MQEGIVTLIAHGKFGMPHTTLSEANDFAGRGQPLAGTNAALKALVLNRLIDTASFGRELP